MSITAEDKAEIMEMIARAAMIRAKVIRVQDKLARDPNYLTNRATKIARETGKPYREVRAGLEEALKKLKADGAKMDKLSMELCHKLAAYEAAEAKDGEVILDENPYQKD